MPMFPTAWNHGRPHVGARVREVGHPVRAHVAGELESALLGLSRTGSEKTQSSIGWIGRAVRPDFAYSLVGLP